MTKKERVTEYARKHLQAVRVCWIDQKATECGAVEAVKLCTDRNVSGRIVGVVAQTKALENMLNDLLDDE